MKVVVLTLGFGNIDVLTRSFRMISDTMSQDYMWWVLNQHYPIPSKEEFRAGLINLARLHHFDILDAGRNLGLHDGLNYMINMLDDDDIVIGLDPDSLPASFGWDKALVDLFKDPTIVWGSLANEHSFGEMAERGFTDEINTSGYAIRVPKRPVINSVCAWRVSWLRAVGGITEPTKYYGGLECSMWRKVNQKDKRWVFLKHFWEHRNCDFPQIADDKYTRYKYLHAHKGDSRSFDEFLEEVK